MLLNLTIRNVALIEYAELSFSERLNVLSGETGAGKSVILDCIDFVLGAKADRGMVRFGASECLVRAEFTADERVNSLLEELDLEPDDVLVISRKLTAEGKGTLKINGCAVPLSMLRKITACLVDVHGQSEHFFLLKEENQLRLLDRVAGSSVTAEKELLKDLLAERKRIQKELQTLGGDAGERIRRLDILRFQIDEIRRAALKEGEEEELVAFRNRYSNLEKILGGLSSARDFLLSDGGSADSLNGARRAIGALAKYGESYGVLAERIENVSAEVEDIAEAVETYIGEMDIDEREAERVEARYDEIRSLKKKYGGSVAEVLRFCARAEEEYGLLSDSGERIAFLEAELQKAENKIYESCLRLRELRRASSESFTKRVTEELKSMNISSARFEIEFGDFSREDVPSATQEGLGGVRFLFSANAGEPLKELGKIISGGEMSRFMLAVKAQIGDANGIGTYIFDEIDAGIGGKTARVVAEKFCKIANSVQIIAVSHLAVIAAFADREFLIRKSEQDGRTFTQICELEGAARLGEIARLIGNETGEHALRFAEEMLSEAGIYKKSLS